jgi:hypothetical protein
MVMAMMMMMTSSRCSDDDNNDVVAMVTTMTMIKDVAMVFVVEWQCCCDGVVTVLTGCRG